MKKKTALILLGFAVFSIVLVGCQKKESAPPKQSSQSQVTPQGGGNGSQPHSFGEMKGADYEFKGGSKVSGYNLVSIRRAPNPTLVRLILDFAKGDLMEAGVTPPLYSIKLSTDGLKLAIKLNGVAKADIMQNKNDIIQLSEVIQDVTYKQSSEEDGVLEISFKNAITYSAFDLSSPARIAVVILPKEGPRNEL